ncbi:MAG: hypothetical protein IJA20_10020 [Methanocorpusculum sp.]|nr:hypothetical protein [Methanocorpusculum sp.]
MKMKNVLMILISLAVVFAMAGAVSGGETLTLSDREGDTKLTYTVQDVYEVTIPSDVTFQASNLYIIDKVNVTKALLQPTMYLHVNLSSNNYSNGFRLVNAGSFIPYNITNASANPETDVANGQVILTVAAGTHHPEIAGNPVGGYGIGNVMKLNFSTTMNYIDMATKSGSHMDVLKFMFWVNNDPAQ